MARNRRPSPGESAALLEVDMPNESTAFRAPNPMRRRGSSNCGSSDELPLASSGSTRTSRVRRKSRRPSFRGRTRMDGSRRMIVLSLAGIFVVFFFLLIVSFMSESSRPPENNVHRKIVPIHHFARYTKDAPDCDEMDPKEVRYTLVTQMSADRMWMMEQHCNRWGPTSPISVAVFTNQSLADVTQKFLDMGCDPGTLSVQTLSTDSYLPDDYPVNVLRTMALSMVQTSHVMYSDVDFWESEDLHDILQEPDVREVLAYDPKRALVVPAFQLNRQCREWRDCREKNIPKMPRTKQDLVGLIKHKNAAPFDPTNSGGHGSTLYKTWFRQHASDVIDIPCIKSNRYEPYMVFRYCHDLPPFHKEFSGYGKNKMTTVMHMRRTGYKFSQLGGGFVVHYPHLDSASRMEWNEGPKELQPFKDKEGYWHKRLPKDVKNVNWTAYKRGRVDKTFVEFKRWLTQEVPCEARVPQCQEVEDDDAKLWYSREEEEENLIEMNC